jgi:hypothetical protein
MVDAFNRGPRSRNCKLDGCALIVFATGFDLVVIFRSRVSPLEQRWRHGLEQ